MNKEIKYEGYSFEQFLTDLPGFGKNMKVPTLEQSKQAEEHNKNYRLKESERDKLDWDEIKANINFRLKLNYIKERLKAAGKI